MRTNKYLIVLFSFFIFSSVILCFLLKKYILLLLHHSIYYCQEMVNALPIRLPGNLGKMSVLAFLITAAIITVKLVVTWIRALRIKNHLHPSLVYTDEIKRLIKKLNIQNKMFVSQNDYPSAFCFGFKDPKIYISTGLIQILSVAELEAVFRHEKYHLENKDALMLFFASIIQSLLPFFPIISDISKNYRIQKEIAADDSVIKGMQNPELLISVLGKLVTYEPKNTLAFTPSLADWDTIEIRIKKLVKQKVKYGRISLGNIVLSLVSFVILGVLALAPVNAVEFHDKGKDIMVLCAQGQSCKSWCEAQVVAASAPNTSSLFTS